MRAVDEVEEMRSDPFFDQPVLGAMAAEQAEAKLLELGETPDDSGRPDDVSTATYGGLASIWPFGEKLYASTAHAFGFLPKQAGADGGALQHAGNIEPDRTLKGARVKIVLNRLRVADYPGSGTHRVLFDFFARNQIGDQAEDLHFNATYRVREGEQAPIVGYPIFIGLCVGQQGLAFRCRTINVKNESDESFLDFIEGDVFRAGLKLATTIQPAIAPLSGLALGITKSIGQRNRNVAVQDFDLGLDFEGTRMGARLAEGDYVVVQIPEDFRLTWRWDDWCYDAQSGQLVARDSPTELIPYNYLVFGISRYDGL